MPCDGTCGTECSMGCGDVCAQICGGACSMGCGGMCSDGCGDECSSGCGDLCSSGCSGECSWSCEYSCSVCTGSCSNECAMGCNNNCKYSCTGFCETNCYGACASNCESSCVDNCFQACAENCADGCKNNCYIECTGRCYESCMNVCRGYCAQNAQNYCNHAQTFTENLTFNNSIGQPKFNWTNPVATNQFIQITHDDWNTLKNYIKAAAGFCYDTSLSPSTSSVDSGDLITAEQFNDLSKALGSFFTAERNKTIISADIINSLKDNYNALLIDETSPTGTTHGKPMTESGCCQSGQTCVTETDFNILMGMTTVCLEGQTALTSCKNGQETITSPS